MEKAGAGSGGGARKVHSVPLDGAILIVAQSLRWTISKELTYTCGELALYNFSVHEGQSFLGTEGPIASVLHLCQGDNLCNEPRSLWRFYGELAPHFLSQLGRGRALGR